MLITTKLVVILWRAHTHRLCTLPMPCWAERLEAVPLGPLCNDTREREFTENLFFCCRRWLEAFWRGSVQLQKSCKESLHALGVQGWSPASLPGKSPAANTHLWCLCSWLLPRESTCENCLFLSIFTAAVGNGRASKQESQLRDFVFLVERCGGYPRLGWQRTGESWADQPGRSPCCLLGRSLWTTPAFVKQEELIPDCLGLIGKK